MQAKAQAMKKTLFILLIIITTCCACGGRSESPAEDTLADSTMVDSENMDTVSISEDVPPKRADELFDDFVYGFMKNKNFQHSRIEFPLRVITYGKVTYIQADQWRHDKLYSAHEVYTRIFADHRAMQTAKDTSVNNVVVENIDIVKQIVKKYIFERKNGEWKLTTLDTQTYKKGTDSEFYTFYERFATDEEFQQAHISPMFGFTTFDEDTFQRIDGTVDAIQWEDFRPELPVDKINNIIYGNRQTNSDTRIMSISGLSGGLSCSLTFKKKNGKWMLTKLEN